MIPKAASASFIALAVVAATGFFLVEGDLFSAESPEARVRGWIAELPREADGRVDPLPVVLPHEPVGFLGGTGKHDPFRR